MAAASPRWDDLVRSVRRRASTDLERVREAVIVGEELARLSDRLVTHFVQTARETGCSWSQIGAELGVSKQAAQQGFGDQTCGRRRLFGRRGRGGELFDRWTDRARHVMVLAQEEAGRLNHRYVGTEHLLLGLVGEDEGVAAKALARLGISIQSVRAQVEEIIGVGSPSASPPSDVPLTPRAKKVLQLSLREAANLDHNYIGTEHLLLGLVREGEGVAAQVLQKLGADLGRIRHTVIELLTRS
jgi:hypothetical protein